MSIGNLSWGEIVKDRMLLMAEWSARQIYWRSPRVRAWAKRRGQRRRPAPQIADRRELLDRLGQIGVAEGALVMAHTSIAGLQLTSGDAPAKKPMGPIELARLLIQDLIDLVGESGTLVMPTHAFYQNESNPSETGVEPKLHVYDPKTTPCGVGLANEIFWRRKDVRRSLFPYNMLAARGPLADELLRDNLNDAKPLPHGIHSGYYRFCRHNGLIVGIGVPLGGHLTLHHVGEEVRDSQWPVRNFFEEKSYVVVVNGERKNVVVRQTRPEFNQFSSCKKKLRRDLVRAGILHESRVGSVRLDWARAKEVFDFLMERNRNSTYPFFFTSLVKTGKKSA